MAKRLKRRAQEGWVVRWDAERRVALHPFAPAYAGRGETRVPGYSLASVRLNNRGLPWTAPAAGMR